MDTLKLALILTIENTLGITLKQTDFMLKKSFSSQIILGSYSFIVVINKALLNKFAFDFLDDKNPNFDTIRDISKEITNLIIGKAKVLFEEKGDIFKLGTPSFIGNQVIKNYNESVHCKFSKFRCSIYKVH